LSQRVAASRRILDGELKPSLSRKFHFGIKHEPALRAVGQQHAPEIQRVSGV
jgi:hypothetical protein